MKKKEAVKKFKKIKKKASVHMAERLKIFFEVTKEETKWT